MRPNKKRVERMIRMMGRVQAHWLKHFELEDKFAKLHGQLSDADKEALKSITGVSFRTSDPYKLFGDIGV